MIKELKIKVNSNFESCDNCIHANDTDEICKMRGCIYAFKENDIKDCYKPKGSSKPPKGRIKKAMEYGYIECSTADEAVELMAKLDHEGVWNDFCYHYNDQEGLWIKFIER